MKTSVLTGALLDYWVARAEGKKVRIIGVGEHPNNDVQTDIFFRVDRKLNHLYAGTFGLDGQMHTAPDWQPSEDWAVGGSVLDRLIEAGFGISHTPLFGGVVCSNTDGESIPFNGEWNQSNIDQFGETVLIAAMRAYVAFKIGDEVPDEIPV